MSLSLVATALHISHSKFERPRTFLSSCSTADGVSLNGFINLLLLSQVTENTRVRTALRSVSRPPKHICRAAPEYKFPDPIPEFAKEETEKFKTHLLNKLSKKEDYQESADEIVGICTEIFSNFLHTEYGGPGTLLVMPFIDMADTVHERGLPGASQAARMAVKWAQVHVDKDWKEWTGID